MEEKKRCLFTDPHALLCTDWNPSYRTSEVCKGTATCRVRKPHYVILQPGQNYCVHFLSPYVAVSLFHGDRLALCYTAPSLCLSGCPLRSNIDRRDTENMWPPPLFITLPLARLSQDIRRSHFTPCGLLSQNMLHWLGLPFKSWLVDFVPCF